MNINERSEYMDIFYEQFLTKDYEFKRKKVESAKQALLILTLLNMIFLGKIIAILTFLVYVILSIIARNKFIEFEYELTGSELIVSKIFNKKNRKIIANININDVIKIKSSNSYINEDIKIINLTLSGIKTKKLTENILIVRVNDSNSIGYKLAMDKNLQKMCEKINPMIFKHDLDILK